MARLWLQISLVCAVLVASSLAKTDPVPYVSQGVCPVKQYFETTSLGCQPCNYASFEPVLGQHAYCQCPAGTLEVSTPGHKECTKCAAITISGVTIPRESSQFNNGTAARACLECRGANVSSTGPLAMFARIPGVWELASWSATASRCTCPAGYAMVDVGLDPQYATLNVGKGCLACPADTWVNVTKSRYTCEPCPDRTMIRNAQGQCACRPGQISDATPGVCVDAGEWARVKGTPGMSITPDTYSQVEYHLATNPDGSTEPTYELAQSKFLLHHFPAAATQCSSKLAIARSTALNSPESSYDATACQALANMCVMHLYTPDAPACALMASLKQSQARAVHNNPDWKMDLPWIEYDEGDAAIATEATDIQREVALKGPASLLNFTLSVTHPNGTWLGYRPLTTQLHLCPGLQQDLTKFRKFGTNMETRCEIDLSDIVNREETLFYDLFVDDVDEDGKRTLYPVPVFITNFKDDKSGTPNTNAEWETISNNHRAFRRFFTVDNLSGIKDTPDGPRTWVVRWASRVTLRTMITAGNSKKIYPPALFVTYSSQVFDEEAQDALLYDADLHVGVFGKATFVSQYSMSLSAYWSTQLILFIVVLLLGFFTWIIRVYGLNRELQSAPMTARHYGVVLAMLCGTVADYLFWFLCANCWYWWLWFKRQDDVFVLMPTDDPHPSWLLLVVIVCVCKYVEVIAFVLHHTSVDIFFIDWEKPRDQSKKASDDSIPTVSVWRSIFVTNEWNELTEARLVNLELTLFAILFFLKGIKLEFLATPQPHASDLSAMDTNWTLMFAVSTFFWLVVSLVQIIYKLAIHHRFFEDPCGQFVDLLSLANISCLIFDSNFHGFYLHGRSVHQFADSTMLEMAKQMQMEEEGQVFKRGLAPNSEDQVFEVFVAPKVREGYDNLFYSTLLSAEQSAPQTATAQANSQKGRGGAGRQALSGPKVTGNQLANTLVLAKERLNNFLQKFISEVQQDPLVIREKTKSFEVCKIPPEMTAAANTSVFFADRDNCFKRLIPIGQEHRLLTFDIMLFTMWSLAAKDVFLAALLTYLCDLLLLWFRSELAQRNLGRKTLVDERFLI